MPLCASRRRTAADTRWCLDEMEGSKVKMVTNLTPLALGIRFGLNVVLRHPRLADLR